MGTDTLGARTEALYVLTREAREQPIRAKGKKAETRKRNADKALRLEMNLHEYASRGNLGENGEGYASRKVWINGRKAIWSRIVETLGPLKSARGCDVT